MKKVLFGLVVLLFVLPLAITAQDADSGDDLPWWNDRVFYEIFVRSFYDSDGDGIGDIQGVISQLDYLNDGDPETDTDLGITGIWFMPISPSPSYHGYDVTDYYGINPDYGTMEDFQQLLDEAHERGIAVIVDLVLNHSSTEHPWFIESQNPESEFADWYVWADEDPGFDGPEGQTVWHPRDGRYYYGLFWSGMPDLNYNTPAVTEQMYDVSRYWLEEVGVDGFRLDAIKFLIGDGERQENLPETVDWFVAYDAYLDTVREDTLTVGEVWDSTNTVSSYVRDEAVDLAFEFDLAGGIVQGASFGITSSIENTLMPVLEQYPEGQFATFLTNHDQNRVMNQVREDVDAVRVAASVYLTLPGVPFIYYGEEIGMVGTKPDPEIRTPMQWSAEAGAGFTTGDPWQAINPDFETVNVTLQNDDPNSLLNHYRQLIHLRNDNVALRQGDTTLIDSGSGNVLSFLRYTDEQTLLVVINMRPREVDNYVLNLEAGPLSGVSEINVLMGEGDFAMPEINADGGLTDYLPLPVLPARSTFVIELVE